MFKSLIKPMATKVLLSQRLADWRQFPARVRQGVSSDRPTLEFFHQLDNPYSLLALEACTELVQRHAVDLRVHVVDDAPSKFQQTESYQRYRLHDARRLAHAWQMESLLEADRPLAANVTQALRCLPSANERVYAQMVAKVSRALWQLRPDAAVNAMADLVQVDDAVARRHSTEAAARREELGHYESAAWYFAGRWYVGLERLDYLEEDLHRWGLATDLPSLNSERFKPVRLPALKGAQLDVFFSFRSPYSYLSLQRLQTLRRQHGNSLNINLRPVLPMVERGVPLSSAKRRYILQDSARIAARLNVPFGRICDPLGRGIDNCLALFDFAKERNLEERYVNSVMHAIWSEGADVSRMRTMARLCERAGLPWDKARHHVFDVAGKERASRNLKQLELMGLWGVPTFALTDNQNRLMDVFWGQDRLPWLEYGLSNRATPRS